MIFESDYRVAWVDTDTLGIVHFSNYFRICERVEEEFLNYLGFSEEYRKEILLPRVMAKCDYKYPLRFNEIARVSMKIDEIGKKHITYAFEIYNRNEGKISAICKITVVAINRDFKSIPIPETFIEKIKPYFEG